MANTYEEELEKTVEEDPRLQAVEAEAAAMDQQIKNTYGGVAADVKTNLQAQSNAVGAWTDEQKQLAKNQQTLTNQQIEQQKQETQDALAKEQTAAYTDYRQQTAKHGVQAEQMAEQGMTGSGYSESANVAAYTAYQNRVATVKASVVKAINDFDIAMKQAQLQNSSAMAQIAFDGLMSQLQLGLQSMQYSQEMAAQQLGLRMDAKNMYHGQYMDIMNQLQREKEFQYQQEQDEQTQANWEAEFQLAGGKIDPNTGEVTLPQVGSTGGTGGTGNGNGATEPLTALGNANTKAAENAIMDEKGFNQYKNTVRTRVNGKSFTNYKDYVLAKIEDMANNGLNGRTFTEEEIEWLLAEYGDP